MSDKQKWADYMREYYRKNPSYAETVRERARERHREIMADPELREKERERCRDKERRHRHERPKQDPVKRRARLAVQYAIRRGDIIKPDSCPECGTAEERIEAHHADYHKPLEIEWLCSLCHGKRHRTRAA